MSYGQVEERDESSLKRSFPNRRAPEKAETVLKDFFDLLEGYAPAWYTEELHNRAAALLAKRVN